MIAIDFFCGGGGMTRGLIDAGINVLAGIDSNPHCRETYEKNNKNTYLASDICKLTPQDLLDRFPQLINSDEVLLVGCAPCQPFSILRREEFDEEGNAIPHESVNLLVEFGRFVQALRPAHILVENVPGLRGKGQDVLDNFKRMLNTEGYLYDEKIIYAKDYGVPQNRRRYVLIASRIFQPRIPGSQYGKDLLPYKTVRETIKKYPSIKAGEENESYANHKAANLKPILQKRISATPHDGGSRTDWPEDLVLNCHKEFKGHTDVYGRMKWDEPSPTLTVKCFSLSNGRFGHPEQDRAISLREAAALQTFPDDYIFYGSMQEIGRQIGNAVPVLLAKVLGEYILNSIN
ncbi:MAG: DNA cytosine methyltransferase [Clostridiales bacterium]|nr:DNA cytosine methyltransferase [Clostridiales bacterium]